MSDLKLYDNIKNVAKQKGISISQLEQDANLTHKTMFRWNDNIPSVDKLYNVSQCLDCDINVLITPDYSVVESDEFLAELRNIYNQLPTGDKIALLSFAKNLLEKNNL